jgi:hypothetical protein
MSGWHHRQLRAPGDIQRGDTHPGSADNRTGCKPAVDTRAMVAGNRAELAVKPVETGRVAAPSLL